MEKTVPLVVDLDGTLLKSDMLHESFWNAFGKNWCIPIFSIVKLWNGKAALKAYLQLESNIDVSSLPYDDDVIAYIIAHKAKGGRTALVTASNQLLAENIAKYLKIFDEVHGSDGKKNLKGPEKASFLVKRFGAGQFAYMGDAPPDFFVWRQSGKVVTVNAGQSIRQQANALGKPVEHLTTTEKSARPYVKMLRPHQWIKNIPDIFYQCWQLIKLIVMHS